MLTMQERNFKRKFHYEKNLEFVKPLLFFFNCLPMFIHLNFELKEQKNLCIGRQTKGFGLEILIDKLPNYQLGPLHTNLPLT